MCIKSGSFGKLLRRRPCHDFLPDVLIFVTGAL